MNWRNYKLITDGEKWAIKKGWIFIRFFDFQDFRWWSRNSKWFRDCWHTKEEAEKWYNRLTL